MTEEQVREDRQGQTFETVGNRTGEPAQLHHRTGGERFAGIDGECFIHLARRLITHFIGNGRYSPLSLRNG